MPAPTVIGTPVFNNGDGTSSRTFAVTVPATGSNRALVVQVTKWASADNAVTGVTYNGNALTLIGSSADDFGGNEYVRSSSFILLNPPTGSAYDVVVTAAGTLATFRIMASAWQDVAQVTPTVTNGQSEAGDGVGGTTFPSPYGGGNLTTVADDVILGGVHAFLNGAYTITPSAAGATTLDEAENGASWGDSHNFWFATATGSATSGNVSTSSDLRQFSVFAFVLAQASGAPVLSNATAIPNSTSALVGADTTITTGTGYTVVDSAANLAGVSETEIKAGQKAGGAAALASGNVAIGSSPFAIPTSGLTPGTLYLAAIVQNDGSLDSNIVTVPFTTPLRSEIAWITA